MKVTVADNGWTTFIDCNINELTTDEIHEVCRLTVEKTVTVFRNQTMTPIQQLKFCQVMGDVQMVAEPSIITIPGVIRVTGKKDAIGRPGLFGHDAALDWHANQPSNTQRKPLIWLYGHTGTVGSKTSWINMIDAYNDLDEDFKEEIKDIKVICGYHSGSYSPSSYFKEHVNKDNPISLVHTNKAGQTGLFFPFLQIFEFEGYPEEEFNRIMTKLKEHVLQDKYAYHHDWQDGDIVIAEQWLGIHKRWAFDKMNERVLHRIAFDYSNVYK